MIIGDIITAPTEYCFGWDWPDYDYNRYMPPVIPDWSRNVRTSIQLSGTRGEWITLLCTPVARDLFQPSADYILTRDIRLTQQVIDRLSEVGISQEQIKKVQQIFDELNEPAENCCAYP